MLILLILNIALLYVVSASRVDYSGYHVVKFEVDNEAHAEFLSKLKHNIEIISDEHPFGKSATLGVPPNYVSYIRKQCENLYMKAHVVYEDLQTIIDLEKSTIDHRTVDDDFDFDVFHTYDSIVEQLVYWSNNCPSGFDCELYSFGQSHEGRDLYTLKVTPPGGLQNAYWMHGATHSREWLGTATLLKIMDRFWTEYGIDPQITALMDGYEWYFAPVTNPDGYVYTHEVDRMWRKNRGPNEGSDCFGTDINRNYDSQWGTEGSSHDPCDFQIYCGSGPASALETQAIQDETSRLAQERTLLAFVDVHTFGEIILMPYGYTVDGDGEVCAEAPTHDNLLQVANAFADAIEETFNVTPWRRGSPCEIFGPSSGGSMDWAIEKGDVLYGFGPELRGPFFTVEPSEIEPSSREFFNGVVAMVDEIKIIEGL